LRLSLIHEGLIVFVDVEELDQLEFVESVQIHHYELPRDGEEGIIVESRVAKEDGMNEIHRGALPQADQGHISEAMFDEVIHYDLVHLWAL
jgi:hypothetical protein